MAHIDCGFFSPTLKKNAHLIAFIPTVSADDYLEDQPTQKYHPGHRWPTLILLHGSYGDCMDWCLRTGVERYAQEKGIAVIMPSGENASYIKMEYGEDYLTYIGKELPEFLRKILPLSYKREETYISGLSMGGYGAFRVALEYPETFSCAASLSGALDMPMLQESGNSEAHIQKMPLPYRKATFGDALKITGTDNDLSFLLTKKVEEHKQLPALYMTCGTEDFILPTNDTFYCRARELNVPVEYEKFPGAHDWNFWDSHIRDVLNWLPA